MGPAQSQSVTTDGPGAAPRASVIICTLNGQPRLPRCLESLFEQTWRDFEIIVVDDGSRDETPAVLDAMGGSSPVPLRRLAQDRRGPAAGRNLGVQKARGDVVVFTDDDVTFDRGWLGALAGRLERDPHAWGVEGMTLPVQDPKGLYRLNLENRTGGRYLTCNIAYRRKAFLEAGGFDEGFYYPCREDSDLAFRILDRGGLIAFEPEARAYHTYYKRSVRLPLRIAGTLSHSVYLNRKHPKRFPLRSLLYPSYGAAMVFAALALGFFLAGRHLSAAAFLGLYLGVVARNLVRDVRLPAIGSVGTFLGLCLTYTVLPWVYAYHLAKALGRSVLGRHPIPAKRPEGERLLT